MIKLLLNYFHLALFDYSNSIYLISYWHWHFNCTREFVNIKLADIAENFSAWRFQISVAWFIAHFLTFFHQHDKLSHTHTHSNNSEHKKTSSRLTFSNRFEIRNWWICGKKVFHVFIFLNTHTKQTFHSHQNLHSPMYARGDVLNKQFILVLFLPNTFAYLL